MKHDAATETATVRAPAEQPKSGEFFHGTIGFDGYFESLNVSRSALKAPKMPWIAA